MRQEDDSSQLRRCSFDQWPTEGLLASVTAGGERWEASNGMIPHPPNGCLLSAKLLQALAGAPALRRDRDRAAGCLPFSTET